MVIIRLLSSYAVAAVNYWNPFDQIGIRWDHCFGLVLLFGISISIGNDILVKISIGIGIGIRICIGIGISIGISIGIGIGIGNDIDIGIGISI
ncbi:hypothetical protein Tco_1276667, partial [Tanacetum coccineum]